MNQPAWMAEAWALYGVAEASGRQTNARVAALYRDAGHAQIKDDAVPWCAAFVGACLARAGLPSTGSLRARSYLDYGEAADDPRPGDIVVLRRGASPTAGHVGFYVGRTRERLFLLGGNQSDAVTVAGFAASRLLGVRRVGGSVDVDEAVPGDDNDAFATALAHVLKMEGGYTNDRYDPGGPTNQGITLATLARYRKWTLNSGSRAELVGALKAIREREVRAIYRVFYWRPSRAGEMPAGLDLMHFDASVNHGVRGAARLLQRAVGVSVDGEIGPITMGAILSADVAPLIRAYADARERRYRALHHFWRFGRGWLNRVAASRKAALAQASASSPQAPPSTLKTPRTSPMSTHSTNADPKPLGEKWWAQSITLWGAFITTLSTVLPIVGPFVGLSLSAAMVEQIGAHVIQILQALGGISGVLLTVFGRMRASTRLHG
ncbi:MAG: TIGR02594 family protein [Pseudomonadota bacterium]